MQGEVSSKGNVDKEKFWKEVMKYEHEDSKE